ncbi:MAG: hypothetical protein FAF03_01740 [Epsilonproteobacteria bacterium]|nr:hypothetical protein [Campylobacterota bacterium]
MSRREWYDKNIYGGDTFFMGCTQNKPQPNAQPECRQESTHATDWIASWRNCAGDGAVKKDGTLWQFGKVEGCDGGQIIPIDSQTGNPIYRPKKYYHLQPTKIGEGFDGATVINSSYRVYAIKKDGTLWGWGERLYEMLKLLSASHDWAYFRAKWEGNGCCAYDVGLKQDGSLWRFPEFFDFKHKDPKPFLKRMGGQSVWDKVYLGCCRLYAMKKDGSIWVNDNSSALVPYTSKACSVADREFCTNIKEGFAKILSGTIGAEESVEVVKIDYSKKGGTLCIMPEIRYE